MIYYDIVKILIKNFTYIVIYVIIEVFTERISQQYYNILPLYIPFDSWYISGCYHYCYVMGCVIGLFLLNLR